MGEKGTIIGFRGSGIASLDFLAFGGVCASRSVAHAVADGPYAPKIKAQTVGQ